MAGGEDSEEDAEKRGEDGREEGKRGKVGADNEV